MQPTPDPRCELAPESARPAGSPSISVSGLRTPVLLLVCVASVFAVREAREFLLPVVLALLLTGVLSPFMWRLTRIGLPRTVAARSGRLAFSNAKLIG